MSEHFIHMLMEVGVGDSVRRTLALCIFGRVRSAELIFQRMEHVVPTILTGGVHLLDVRIIGAGLTAYKSAVAILVSCLC